MKLTVRRAALAGLAAAVLVAIPASGLGQDKPTDPAARYEALVQRYDKEYAEYGTAIRAAKTNEEKLAAKARMPKASDFAMEFRDLAKEQPKTETALKCWLKVVELGGRGARPDLKKAAIDALVADHLTSDKLADLPYYLGSGEDGEGLLRTLAERSPHRTVQGRSLFVLAEALAEAEEGDVEKKAAEAKSLLLRIQKDYADVKDRNDGQIGDAAKRILYALENLAVGKVAPDIAAKDLNDVAFKLSDYRGKVVMLDFWGNW